MSFLDLVIDGAGDTLEVDLAGDWLSAGVKPVRLPAFASEAVGDIATVSAGQPGDWAQLGAALQAGDDLTTAVLISVFTDQAAEPEDEIPGAQPGLRGDPRGWFADAGQPYKIGSRLWLYRRSKQTQAVLTKVEDCLRACLAWMVADGAVASVDAKCWYPSRGQLRGKILLTRIDGALHAVNFQTAWGGG